MIVPNNKITTFRFSVPDDVNSFTIPVDTSWVLLKNVGTTNSVRFNFDDDAASDYWTLPAEVSLPAPIRVKGGSNFNTDGVGGSTVLEVIAWG